MRLLFGSTARDSIALILVVSGLACSSAVALPADSPYSRPMIELDRSGIVPPSRIATFPTATPRPKPSPAATKPPVLVPPFAGPLPTPTATQGSGSGSNGGSSGAGAGLIGGFIAGMAISGMSGPNQLTLQKQYQQQQQRPGSPQRIVQAKKKADAEEDKPADAENPENKKPQEQELKVSSNNFATSQTGTFVTQVGSDGATYAYSGGNWYAVGPVPGGGTGFCY
ncbi:MAG: hypothetical protein U0136_17975 [Bdellovibrionota bacterium]